MVINRLAPQRRNVVHGGAIFTLADLAFAAASNSHGTVAVAINASIWFVTAAREGTLYAEAKEVSRNPKLATYSIQVTDDSRRHRRPLRGDGLSKEGSDRTAHPGLRKTASPETH